MLLVLLANTMHAKAIGNKYPCKHGALFRLWVLCCSILTFRPILFSQTLTKRRYHIKEIYKVRQSVYLY